MSHLHHIHLIVTAYLTTPPITVQDAEKWLRELVALVDMQILMDAKAIYCEDLGNEGVTGIVGLTTSHASFHSWHDAETPFMGFDIYSCRDFDKDIVLKHLDRWGLERCHFMLIDRDPTKPLSVIEQGTIVSPRKA